MSIVADLGLEKLNHHQLDSLRAALQPTCVRASRTISQAWRETEGEARS